MVLLAGPGTGQAQAPDPFAGAKGSSQTERERDPAVVRLLGSSEWLNAPSVDVQIAQWLRQVRQGRMGPPEFYQRLGAAGVGMKHVDAVKTRIEAAGGSADFLGPTFAEGGTPVERSLLAWRLEQTKDSIRESLRSVEHRTTVFVGYAGKWPTQHPNALTFSGDIDFSYITADPDLGLRLKRRFESDFRERTGAAATAEGADVVATAHGRAGLEVYIARHGQAFAERTMTDLQRADAGGGLTPVDRDAMFALVAEEGDLIGPSAIRRAARDAEPGLSMEMVRHYTGDIVRTDRFSLRDQIVKASKYLDRAMKSAGVPAGAEDLAAFAASVTRHARDADIRELARRIREHFGDAIGVRMVDGRLVVEMDTAQLAAFQRDISATIWDGARAQLEKRVGELQNRFAAAEALSGEERARAIENIRPDYVALVDMMKAELLVLSHEKIDVPKPIHELDARLAALDRFLRAYGRGLTAEELAEKRWLEELIRSKSPVAHRFAIGRLVHLAWQTVERANHVLDYLDRRLLDDLRRYPEIEDLVREAGAVRADLRSAEPGRVAGARERLKAGGQKAVAVVRGVNVALNEEIQTFAAARGAVKVVMVKGLIDEYLVYRDAFARGDWNGFAMEFFRRRVPFFSAAENAAMGNDVLAVVDVVTTLVPHLALARAVEGIAEEVEGWAIEFYWSEQLRLFVDGLYASARFTLVDVETYGDAKVGEWRLATVTFDGATYNLGKPPAGKRSYLALKRVQIQSMYQELRVRRANRLLYRDLEYGLFDSHRIEWLLHHNLARTDPFLTLYEELQRRADVGEALRDHFQDIWLVRWEELKLAFVFNLIKELEDRHKAEQGVGAGQLPDLFAQLTQIASDLDIADAMQKAMDAEWSSSEGKMLLAWFWNFKRDLLMQPDIKSETTKAAEIVLRHLETYRSIRTARDVVERDVMRGKSTDDGLRLLTGARFLTGRRDVDQRTAQAWSERITTMNRAVNAELLAIKARYADPKGPKPALDAPFDQAARMDVLREDIWRAAWIFVSSDAGPAQQEGARSRADTHKRQRDQLVREFEAHYARPTRPADEAERPPSRPKDFWEDMQDVIARSQGKPPAAPPDPASVLSAKEACACIAEQHRAEWEPQFTAYCQKNFPGSWQRFVAAPFRVLQPLSWSEFGRCEARYSIDCGFVLPNGYRDHRVIEGWQRVDLDEARSRCAAVRQAVPGTATRK